MRQSCRRVAIALLFAGLLPIASAAQTPSHLNHQGILTDSNGVVVADGEYGLEFGIYDAPAAGTLHFQQQLSVNVVGGLYNVLLSDNGSWVLKDAFDDPNRFLQIRIVTSPGGTHDDLTLEPRQQIASVPFAFRSDSWGVASLPERAIILWMDGPTCPEGFAEVEALRNILLRGADIAGANSAIPDDPGEVCPGGTGCGASSASYDDTLQLDEMPAHSHDSPIASDLYCWGDSDTVREAVSPCDEDEPVLPTGESGGGQPQHHPFATVLFCQRQP
jgi:hypothetical protein